MKTYDEILAALVALAGSDEYDASSARRILAAVKPEALGATVLRRPTREDELRLAVEAHIDPKTVRRALRLGASAIRGRAGERLAAAAVALGLDISLAA